MPVDGGSAARVNLERQRYLNLKGHVETVEKDGRGSNSYMMRRTDVKVEGGPLTPRS